VRASRTSNEDILGSMEFALQVSGAKVIAYNRPFNCGAIKGAIGHR